MIWRLAVVAAICAALGGSLWWFGNSRYEAGYQARKTEDEAASEAQRETNRSTARTAEAKESVRTVYRDRYLVKTIREIEHASEPLANCPLPADVRRLLGDAATCANSDRPGACGPNDTLPKP